MSHRPPKVFWWFVGTGGGVVLLFVVVWLAIGWRYASGVPTADPHFLDSLDRLQPRPAVPDGGWDSLERATRALETQNGIGPYDLGWWAFRDLEPLAPWSLDLVGEVPEWFDRPENRASLHALIELVTRLQTMGELQRIDLLYPDHQDSWERLDAAARAVAAEAVFAIERGEGSEAATALHALLHLGALFRERPLLDQLERSVEWVERSLHLVEKALHARCWEEIELDRLAGALAAVDPAAAAVETLEGERQLLAARLESSYTGEPGSDGRVTPAIGSVTYGANAEQFAMELFLDDANPGMTSDRVHDVAFGPLLFWYSPSRPEVHERGARLLGEGRAALLDPGPIGAEALDRLRSSSASLDSGHVARVLERLDLTTRLRRSLAGSVERTRRLEARLDAARLALAAERFRLARGRFPATGAEARDAGFGGPADRGAAGPFRLAVRGERLIVYADGADGDDDGGRAVDPEDPMAGFPPLSSSPPPAPDGDVILFGG